MGGSFRGRGKDLSPLLGLPHTEAPRVLAHSPLHVLTLHLQPTAPSAARSLAWG